MPGVTHIQVQTLLKFDDGSILGFPSQVMYKDIRHGDIFTDEEIAEALNLESQHFGEFIKEHTSKKIYLERKALIQNEGRPPFWRKPNTTDPFSAN
jgi:hypothetical protein